MIKGSIIMVDNIDDAVTASYYSKVLYVGELNRNLPPQFIECSILLPPFESVSAEVDGNLEAARQMYMQYLNTSEQAYGMFATIIVALNHGTNITLYIDRDDSMSYVQTLMEYFITTFGLVVGNTTISPAYNPMYNHIISAVLYSYMDGFINEDQFLSSISFPEQILMLSSHRYLSAAIAKIQYKFKLNLNVNELIEWIFAYKNRVNTPRSMITILED